MVVGKKTLATTEYCSYVSVKRFLYFCLEKDLPLTSATTAITITDDANPQKRIGENVRNLVKHILPRNVITITLLYDESAIG